MYRLLVVDDEPIIADGLHEMLKELQAFDLDVYKAYSGFEALTLLNSKKIDLVVTDICMQGMDGLQLVRKIRGNWPECKIVFLTGHDGFDYAYQALQLSGVSYLLKNEGYETIEATVRMHLTDLEKSLRDEHLLRKAKDQLEKAVPLLRRELMTDLIEYGESGDWRERLAELDVGLSADKPVMLVIGCRETLAQEKEVPPFGRTKEDYAVSLLVNRYLSSYVVTVDTVYRRSYFIWFAQPIEVAGEETDWRMTEVFVKGALELAQKACEQSLGLSMSFLVSGVPAAWGEIASKFTNLRSLLNQSLGEGPNVFLVTDEFYAGDARRPPRSEGQEWRMQKLLQHLSGLELLLEQDQPEPFFRDFGELRSTFTSWADGSKALQSEIKQRLSLFFVSFLNRNHLADPIGAEVDIEPLLLGYPSSSLEETFDSCARVAEAILRHRRAERERRSATAVLETQQYIQEHLEADLSLTSLADRVYFNPKYFSRLFRQETGEYLSDYIHERRLEKARNMLAQPQFKIHAVAAAIGFQSASYFTRFFKKTMQMTPQEYRDKAIGMK